ncbi:hypothetical protein AZE42_07007 [Rhizopogon vesiculosus]|uniref:Uncharacterized protein n=1 Tax=Rhizopogon vesiculosus TaxID=180088 RepID=A0A1J8Q206_9AGAM|nr:hypothetical protein AZE42_07007 [Rhizopogon vesiculosus]
MGNSSSKAARRLPKEKPSWAGTRTPSEQGSAQETRRSMPSRPLAFEHRTDAVEADAKDPQFMSKLSRLGPVQVDHHMRPVRPADYIQNMYRSRIQSEVEASPSHSTRNRLLAASLSELLESRKTIKSQAELQALAERYGIDVTKLTELARFINTPSIDGGTIVKTVNQDGEETLTMMAQWVDPKLE